jgi:inorganic pyrophosphatase
MELNSSRIRSEQSKRTSTWISRRFPRETTRLLKSTLSLRYPKVAPPIKYEVDNTSGALFVDRFLHTPMVYPANYGFIPQTLCDEGDPCDVLVVSQVPVVPLAVVRCRPIGGLVMKDNREPDEKIIAVPSDKLNPYYVNVRSLDDLPKIVLAQIAYFFSHYKDLEERKWVEVLHWMDLDAATDYIAKAIARAERSATD